jgi:GxxExxY protein
MDTNRHELGWEGESTLLHGPLVYEVVGCALEVMGEIGHGLNEKTYENSMIVEFGLRNISYDQQKEYDVLYKGVKVSKFIPDLVVDNAVIVDLKMIDRIGDHEKGQMLNCLHICRLQVGVILNFYRRKLEWQRLVL